MGWEKKHFAPGDESNDSLDGVCPLLQEPYASFLPCQTDTVTLFTGQRGVHLPPRPVNKRDSVLLFCNTIGWPPAAILLRIYEC